MSENATDVITEVLAMDTQPTAGQILDALDSAGYRVIRPESGPAWMPATPRSLAKVYRYAELANKGKTPPDIADTMRVSVRQAERYGAAAHAYGLIERRR